MAASAVLPPAGEWSRKYPPLVAILVALILAVAVLPSALNLPQTNPTQTLEYAPVPPEDDEPPPEITGNLSSLGLGSSSGVEGSPGEGGGPTIPPIVAKGKNPTTKRCVGTPPRQTEDPIAPPCVAFFDGDNFGNTYQGVTKDEIRILIYQDGFTRDVGSSKGTEDRPDETYFDLFKPPDPNQEEHIIVKKYRGWQRYFNERFQTYGRVVHFYVYFGGSAQDPENRRAHAAENFSTVKPFAVLSSAGRNEIDYVEAMAKKGVLNFGSFAGKPREFFARYPKMIWGYAPSLEQQAEQYSTYVCSKVVGQPAALGNYAGQPRKFGYISTADDNFPGYIFLADLVRAKVEACGVELSAEATFPKCCYVQDNSTTPDYAATAMADFQQKGVTTILWAGGMEGNFARAALASNYQPEWVLLGDATLSGNEGVRLAGASSTWDDRAVLVTPRTFEPAVEQQRCYQAYREVDTQMPLADASYDCGAYRNLFQLFTGIQVAGPRLGPTSVDQGMHAIPAIRSNDVQTPACFYDVGDYTCVKDAQVEVWDAQGVAPGDSSPGCWRGLEGGKRYLPGEYPEGNIDAQITGNDPCNGFSGGWTIQPA